MILFCSDDIKAGSKLRMDTKGAAGKQYWMDIKSDIFSNSFVLGSLAFPTRKRSG